MPLYVFINGFICKPPRPLSATWQENLNHDFHSSNCKWVDLLPYKHTTWIPRWNDVESTWYVCRYNSLAIADELLSVSDHFLRFKTLLNIYHETFLRQFSWKTSNIGVFVLWHSSKIFGRQLVNLQFCGCNIVCID